MKNKDSNLAKNTAFLYIRMFITLVVSLFTTRIILKNLGAEDYGIYNVVGSIVSLFTFLQTAMSSANYRFFAFSIGQNDTDKLNKAFKSSIIISLCIIVSILFLGESIGIYYILNHINVPPGKLEATMYTFQFSLLSCCIQTAYMPFFSLVIAHEKMSFFAYLSIIEVFIKILIAFSISYSPIENIIFYSLLILICNCTIYTSYMVYCKIHFKEVKAIWTTKISKSLTKEMSSFSAWTLFVTIADILVMQGMNIMINSFFTPIVNAARGIAVQIQLAVDQFRSNLQTAFNPQITKNYANDNLNEMYSLMIASGKYAAFIMIFLSIPLILSVDFVLNLWLVEVPQYTADFLILVLIACIIDGISNPFVTAIGATGNVKSFQIAVGCIKILIIPTSLFFLYNGSNPIHLFWIYLIGTLIVVSIRILIAARAIKFPLKTIIYKLLFPIILVTCLGLLIDYFLYEQTSNNILSIVCFYIESIIALGVIMYAFGLERHEKDFLKNLFNKKILKRRNPL